MFERFTEKAVKVIMLAQEESLRFGHNFVGTESLLLGLIGEGTGLARNVLASFGVRLQEARTEVEAVIGRGEVRRERGVSVEMPFTASAKSSLHLALAAARQLENDYIGAEYLLLGLVREGEGGACQVLSSLGVNLVELEERLLEAASDQTSGSSDLKQTRVYQEALEEGERLEERSEARALILRLLTRKLDEIPQDLRGRIEELSLTQLQNLGEALLDFEQIDDLVNWLEANRENS